MIHFQAATPRELDAQRALRTFYSYILSWKISAGNATGALARQAALPGIQRLQGGTPIEAVTGPFLRGMLTLRAMEALPVVLHPELATSANYWAPVQAYYSCHGLGMAVMAALALPPPRDHRRFLSAMATQPLPRLYPYPFNLLCSGDTKDGTVPVTFAGVAHTAAEVTATNNLLNPHEGNSSLLAAKSVQTTRRWWLEKVFDKQRDERKQAGRGRGNLNRADKGRLAGALHGTSILDFMYRMRVRTNYDDPEMFIYGQTDRDTAVAHYENLLSLVQTFAHLSHNIIRQKVGTAGFARLLALAPDSGTFA